MVVAANGCRIARRAILRAAAGNALRVSSPLFRRRALGCGSPPPRWVIALALRNCSLTAPKIVRCLLPPAVALTAEVLPLSLVAPLVVAGTF